MEKRKAFNFYRSYFEIAQELSDMDRLKFYDAILKKQFDNIDIELDGVVKFAYLSQKHSIDKQIQGYFDKTKDKVFAPTQGPTQGPTEPPTQGPARQEQEKEQEKEQLKPPTYAHEIINANPEIKYDAIRNALNITLGTNHLPYNKNVQLQITQLFANGVTIEDCKRVAYHTKNDEWQKNNNYRSCAPHIFFTQEHFDKYNRPIEIKEDKPKIRAPWD